MKKLIFFCFFACNEGGCGLYYSNVLDASPSSRGLGQRVLIPPTPVRIRVEMPIFQQKFSGIAGSGFFVYGNRVMLCVYLMLYVLLFGALFSLLFSFRPRLAATIGATGAICGSLIALLLALGGLSGLVNFQDDLAGIVNFSFGSFPAIFMFPIALIGFAGAIHSVRYIGTEPKHGIAGVYYFAFCLTVFAMLCCTLIDNMLLFLLSWEIMGLASFMLVYFDFRSRGVDRASWIYLLSCEAGGLLLMFAFSRLVSGAGQSTAALVCGMLGFGLKAGFPVLHVWLPKAHPVAPAPVSALMSGAMVNLGIFGLMKFFRIDSAPCGWILGVLGLAGILTGIMFSLTKRNIKTVLAYSTVENCGIITFGIGCGILGKVYHLPGLEAFGYLGAVMHIFNHASLKGALFLGAGSVYHATGTLDADKLGGLIRKMPSTGAMFTGAALAISGVPPFNAFLSELILYAGLFSGMVAAVNVQITFFCAAGIIVLGAAGAFALASLIRITSGVFYAEPRDQKIFDNAAKELPSMGRAIFITLVPSIFMAFFGSRAVPLFFNTVSRFFSFEDELYNAAINRAVSILSPVCRLNIAICIVILVIYALRRLMEKNIKDTSGPTWDCGYVKPTARMEYTSSALVQSITDFFSSIFGVSKRKRGSAINSDQGSDIADRMIWNLIFRITARWSERIHKFQTGYLHFYILVMVISLLAMLVWAYLSGKGGVK